MQWVQRLDRYDVATKALMVKMLRDIAKASDGLTMAQIRARLAKLEPDAERRTTRVTQALRILENEGYLSPPDVGGRVRFRSFLLADFWRRNDE